MPMSETPHRRSRPTKSWDTPDQPTDLERTTRRHVEVSQDYLDARMDQLASQLVAGFRAELLSVVTTQFRYVIFMSGLALFAFGGMLMAILLLA